LLPADENKKGQIIGILDNTAEVGISNVLLNIVLLDESGEISGERQTTMLLNRIPPGGVSPFLAPIYTPEKPTYAEFHILRYMEDLFIPSAVDITMSDPQPLSVGELVIQGTLENPGKSSIAIEKLLLLGRDQDGRLFFVLPATSWISYLPPGGIRPFTMLLDVGMDTDHISAAYEAKVIDPNLAKNPLVIPMLPRVHVSPKGRVNIIGEVENQGPQERNVAMLIAIKRNGEWLSATLYEHPIPLGPSEVRPFHADMELGLRSEITLSDIDSNDLNVDIWIDPLRSQVSDWHTIPLEIQITSIEHIDRSIVFLGVITNRGPTLIRTPTITASLYSADGNLINTDYENPGASLHAGKSIDFTVSLSIPRDVELATIEFDLWSAGLSP
jgi:hypothetical protein